MKYGVFITNIGQDKQALYYYQLNILIWIEMHLNRNIIDHG